MHWDKEVTINKRKIALDEATYFIADIAANHNGDLEKAKQLIYLAKEAGADCAKFQHFLADKIVSDFGFKSLKGGQSHQAKWEKSVFDIYDQYHCRREWTEELVRVCQEVDIEFMTTPYDFDVLSDIDSYVHAYKIGSGDITWLDFLSKVAQMNKTVLLACGASNQREVELAVDAILQHTSRIVLMQCNTNYSASLDNFKYVNLNVLNSFKQRYPEMILGLSDHTPGHATALGAVALGARVIEKHFTDDNNQVGPDHQFAMNPTTWREMVDRTRELEYALGDGIKRVEANELETVIIQRRCLRVKEALKAGHLLEHKDIEVLRPAPADACLPSELSQMLAKRLLVDKQQGDSLKWGDIAASETP